MCRRARAPRTGTEDAGTPLLPPLISLFGGSCPWQAPAPNPVWNLKLPKSLLGLATASSIPLGALCQHGGSRPCPQHWMWGNCISGCQKIYRVRGRGLGTPRLPPALGDPFIALLISQRGDGGVGCPCPQPWHSPGTGRTATAPAGQRCRLSLPPAPHWAPGN